MSGFTSSTVSSPPVIMVEPVTPFSSAVHVLAMLAAVKTSWPEVFTGPTVAVLVTDPVGPVVPTVLTLRGPC